PRRRAADGRMDPVRPEPGAGWFGSDLGEDEEVLAAAGDGLCHELFRVSIAVHFGRVDPGHPGVEGRSHGVDHHLLRFVRTPHVTAGLPGAVADHRALRSVAAELWPLHATTSPCPRS